MMKLLKDSMANEILVMTQQCDTLRRLHTAESEGKDRVCTELTEKLKQMAYQKELCDKSLKKAQNDVRKSHNEKVEQNEMNRKENMKIEAKLIEERLNVEKIKVINDKIQEEKSKLLEEVISLKTTISGMADDRPFQRQQKQQNQQQQHQPSELLFKGEKSPFSNLFLSPIAAYGIQFRCVESAYQWRKSVEAKNFAAAGTVLEAVNGYEAMKIGQKIQKSQDWDASKRDIMRELLKLKINSCAEYRESIVSSLNKNIVENTSNEFWGRGRDGNGQNVLGHLHMEIRSLASLTPNAASPGDMPTAFSPLTPTDTANHGSDSQRAKPTAFSPRTPTDAADSHRAKRPTIQRPQNSRRGITVIGNSLTRDIHLGEQINHATLAPTIRDIQTEIAKAGGDDICVLQGITNEARLNNLSPNRCAETYVHAAKAAAEKFSHIIVSMGTPQNDLYANEYTHEVNNIVGKRLKFQKNIVCWYHNNLFLKGGSPRSEFLASDGFHLNSDGKYIYASNLKSALKMCKA